MLNDILIEKKTSVLKGWLKQILDTYPIETSRFLKQEKDRFLNPVGYTFTKEIEAIYEELLNEKNSDRLFASLENIIKIKAVQEFSPSEAISFIFILKGVIREELKNNIRGNDMAYELMEIDNKIDTLALLSFDIYMKCREKIYEIRVNETKRNLSSFLKRAKLIYEIPDEELSFKGKTI
ncbi:MAG: RsbRD N-terminal domain-containing protein [Thermodesulfobacteriota bacterium]|nr:RsbRD N-terminal domain-containing protein [Thermodesulfobacteriota bacterium]